MEISRRRIVSVARAWIGTPYHHQASCKGVGCDCLGLVRGVWRELYGQEPEAMVAYTPDWGEARGDETLLAAAGRNLQPNGHGEARAGDVLVFRLYHSSVAKHTAIMATSESMIHAQEGVAVCEVHLGRWWRRHIAGLFSFPGTTD